MPTKRLVTADKALNSTLTDEIIDEVYNQHNAPLMECITGAPTLMSYKAFAREIELEVLTRLKKRLGLADGPPKPEHKVALIAHPKSGTPVIATRVHNEVDFFQVSGAPIPASKIKKHLPIELEGLFNGEKSDD